MALKSIFQLTALAATALTLTACATTSQYSSGQDYVARYQQQSANFPDVAQSSAGLDNDIMRIASVEPMLEFPARVGLARIHKYGQLTHTPVDEARIWQDLAERMGGEHVSFTPVSPVIAGMVSSELPKDQSRNTIAQIRAGAARQHLDYVLIYEITQKDDNSSNALRLADLSVLGLFVLPSRDVEVDITASAMLLDVRNGYPYGTASVFKTKKQVATMAGSSKRRDIIAEQLRTLAVSDLAEEVEVFTRELRIKRAEYILAQAQ